MSVPVLIGPTWAAEYNTALTPGPGDTQARALYPYSIPTFYDRSIGTANYNALQVQLDKRYSSGFSYQVAYTWSKALSEDDGWFGVEGQVVQDPYHPSASYGLSGTNMPNVFSANGLYQIPVGPGKQFSTGSKFFDYIVGNWQINSIFTWRDGQDFTARTATIGPTSGAAGNAPTRSAIPTFRIEVRPSGSIRPRLRYPLSTLLATRDEIRFERNDTSLSILGIIRAFPFWREGVFEFRAEAFNIFNHPVFGGPNNDVFSPSFGSVS